MSQPETHHRQLSMAMLFLMLAGINAALIAIAMQLAVLADPIRVARRDMPTPLVGYPIQQTHFFAGESPTINAVRVQLVRPGEFSLYAPDALY